jgi:ABC-2 type transport system ATP-binding protein
MPTSIAPGGRLMAGELLRVQAGPASGTEVRIGDELLIGRDAGMDGSFGGDPELSRRHARIVRLAEGGLVIEDLGSTNGTFLNGWKIPVPQFLAPGDRIEVGGTMIEFVGQGQVTVLRSAMIEGGTETRRSDKGSVLSVRGITKSYGEHHVLHGVDLEIQPGEIVGLLGPNGAGKTTLVSIIAGLRTADSGAIRINGIDALADARTARTQLGIAPQDLGIYPTLTVEHNLRILGRLNGLDKRLVSQRVTEVADALSLTPMLARRAGTLSGGQQRRLHTGMAMLHHPPLLILDEPTVGADIRTRQEILEAVKSLAAEGRAVCYSTHYLPEIEELGASVAILDGGRIVARGSIAELIRECATTAVEVRFDGAAPQVDFPGQLTVQGDLLRLETDDPKQAAAALLNRIARDAPPIASIEVLRPSLDSVYLALTNRHYADAQSPPDGPGEDVTPLAAAMGGDSGVTVMRRRDG